ncbi:MAG: PaaI family thioesterase [Anaerolineae bacterium]|nr:PaaI family thioesterase [Anaerolineae bacterium]
MDIPSHWKPQPTSRMCFVCGRENEKGLHIQFYEDHENNRIVAPINLPEHFQGYPGITHGGIIASILDEISGRSVMMTTDGNPFWVTAKLEIRYRKPTPTNTPLLAVGWVVKQRRRSAEVAGQIRESDGTVTAEVNAVIVYPPKETLKGWEQEQKYWRVENN